MSSLAFSGTCNDLAKLLPLHGWFENHVGKEGALLNLPTFPTWANISVPRLSNMGLNENRFHQSGLIPCMSSIQHTHALEFIRPFVVARSGGRDATWLVKAEEWITCYSNFIYSRPSLQNTSDNFSTGIQRLACVGRSFRELQPNKTITTKAFRNQAM